DECLWVSGRDPKRCCRRGDEHNPANQGGQRQRTRRNGSRERRGAKKKTEQTGGTELPPDVVFPQPRDGTQAGGRPGPGVAGSDIRHDDREAREYDGQGRGGWTRRAHDGDDDERYEDKRKESESKRGSN